MPKRKRRRFFSWWLVLQKPATVKAGSGETQEPVTPLWCPTWVARAQELGPFLAAFPEHQQGVGLGAK